ncbi:MAG TPA: hypothetical protein PL070_16630 [Flavobacteriales bacterium]|nr:hypothetical protein [Flavobacteriales bacterium]
MRLAAPLLLTIVLGMAFGTAHAQTFDLEQFDQLFRPRLRLDARYTPGVAFSEQPGSFEDRNATGVFTIPLWKKWTAGVELNLFDLDPVSVLKNSVRVRASQVMANVRYSGRELRIGDDVRTLHSGSIGALGISLTKKYRILFWSVNANVSEEAKTLDRAVPRFNGIIGKMQVKGLRRQLFYGVALTVSDGLNLPVPFVGGNEPIGDRWSFQYILPLQLGVGYKAGKNTRFLGGIGVDGFRSGFERGVDRANLTYTAFRGFINVRHKLSKTLQLRAEVAGLPVHALRIPDANNDLQRYPIDAGVNVMVGMNIFFGESTLERLLEDVIR